jgi:cobalt/nickel transport protein
MSKPTSKRVNGVLAAALACGLTLAAAPAWAHFQMIIPSDDMVQQGESRELNLDVKFWHPLEGHGMNMETPKQFGVMIRGRKSDLLSTLKPARFKDATGAMRDGFKTTFNLVKPGDHVFYIVPKPYWEPSEDVFIVHYTKVVVNGLGLEVGWDQEVGLKAEIVPLTRPYGLWKNNVFQGQVKYKGKPVPGAEVEVEYYDPDGKVHPPADPMITQVVKADGEGVFTYAMPRAGWWGFAALMEGDTPMKHDGQEKGVEEGALIWVKTYDMD